jgi:hypothetical protein
VNHHRLQNWIEVGPDHWVVARPNRWGGFEVVEITPQARHVHTPRPVARRAHADVLAAAVAATRTHHTLDAEDTR